MSLNGHLRLDEIRLGSRTLQPHRQLLVNGRREPIGKRALDILSVLGEAGGQIVTKDELLDAVWPGVTVEENALQVHIVALRKALGPEADRLKTIRGVGYQLDIDGGSPKPAENNQQALSPDETALRTSRAVTTTLSDLNFGTASAWARRHPWGMGLATLLLALVGTLALFGSDLGLGPRGRIPVVVRELTAATTGDPTEAALARGVTDELIIRLRRIQDLRVATADSDGTVPADAFEGAYRVDGSIRRSGEQLRVTVRLMSAVGEVLWSQTFDRPLTDLLNVQEAIAAAVADALSVSLDVGTNATEFGGTSNPEAFAAYLQAGANLYNPDLSVPVRYFERALALDPNYIKALNLAAGYYATRATDAATREQALAFLARADEISARAIAANPDLWVGHSARGWYYSNSKDLLSGEREFERIAALDHGTDPDQRGNRATWELNMGRSRNALALFDSNEVIDPIRRNEIGRVWGLANAGRYQDAIDEFERLDASSPGRVDAFAPWAYWSHLALGKDPEDSGLFLRRFPPGTYGLSKFDQEAASLNAMSAGQLREWAAREFGEGKTLGLIGAALFASHRGHPKLATDLLRLVHERPGGFIYIALWTPLMEPTRKTDEFEQLVNEFGLVEVWRATGKWPDACRPVSVTEITCH